MNAGVAFVIAVLSVVVGMFVYNVAEDAYKDYRHEEQVKQCKSENRDKAPTWASDFTDWACEKMAD